MKPFNWNPDKNHKLIYEREVSFEDVVYYLQSGGLLDDISHPNQKQYPHQRIFVVCIDQYVCLVPYAENDEKLFLKTVIPSRKATKQYLGGRNETH